MHRLSNLYRLARSLSAVWSWHPPRGVQCFVRVNVPGRWLTVLLTDGDTYVTAYHPWICMGRAEIRRKLDETALVLADQRKLLEAAPAPWTSPALARAGAEFDLVIERQKREMRRRREIIPITEAKKGGA